MSEDESVRGVSKNFLDYDWGKELVELEQARQEAFSGRGVCFEEEDATTPAGHILLAAKAARQRPEIWSIYEKFREDRKADSETGIGKENVGFLGVFKRWFQLKHEFMNDHSLDYVVVNWLLAGWAVGEIVEDDAASMTFILEDETRNGTRIVNREIMNSEWS